MNVAIRADASRVIGVGHIMRCLTLATGAARHGARVRFVSRDLPLYLASSVERAGHELAVLPPAAGRAADGDLAHAGWLQVTQAEDARETMAALAGVRWDWLVVDHYGIDARWERALRAATTRVLVIDDLADRAHACDMLLDQNVHLDIATRYDSCVPASARRLLGPRYALVRDEFAVLRARARDRDGRIARILVFMGGGDPHDYTSAALAALVESAGEWQVDVVVGAGHVRLREIERCCVGHGYTCHVQTDRMAELTAAADLALGASGSASWERCCLGVPAICVATASNQAPIGEALEAAGAIMYVRGAWHDAAEGMRRALERLEDDPVRVRDMSAAAATLVDGRGVARVLTELEHVA